jgi:hypothetical protein
MPEAQEKQNIRVTIDKPKANEIALRSNGVSKKVAVPTSVTDKAAATPAITKLAAMILDRLVKSSEDEMEMQANPNISQMILQGGGRIIGIEVTGLKFKVLYAAQKDGPHFTGYAPTEVK